MSLCLGLPGRAGTRKVKPICILLKQYTVSGSGIIWDMQVCTSLQTDNHASTPPLSFFTGRMPFLPPNQQCQSIVTKLGRKLADQLDDDREISFLFQRLSVLIQWYNAILLYDCFVNDEQ